ncbi:DUF3108 domain-containing protein [Desulfuromonas sp.]|uniref:DUF3108 domain-containing protein n=1 Tax=Desulfuromonas sp. TaxID=892 RepID=UPI0025BF2A60|nr:DUF3108 domain-containing protein [Desulfuromonas sp.]
MGAGQSPDNWGGSGERAAGIRRKILLLLLLVVFFPGGGEAAEPPESLEFDITWAGIRVGRSSIESVSSEKGLEIVSRVDSAAWTLPFYVVEDRERSTLERDGSRYVPVAYGLALHEGKNRVRREALVDRRAGLVRLLNPETGEQSEYPLAGPVWDPVSCLYHLRHRPLEVGQEFALTLLDKDSPNRVRVKVLRREKVKTAAGIVDTLVVRSDMAIDSEGLFYARGSLTMWLSEDGGRVPVLIEKRIPGLFNNGMPGFLKKVLPDALQKSLENLEVIRAELVHRG